MFPQGFSCLVVLWILSRLFSFRIRDFYPLRSQLSNCSFCYDPSSFDSPNPELPKYFGLGFSAFARHYLRNHFCFLFLRVLRCFSSPRLPPTCYVFTCRYLSIYPRWVSPFGNLRINGYLRLIVAYRSLSRPSSASGAKAFPLCPYYLDLCVTLLFLCDFQ